MNVESFVESLASQHIKINDSQLKQFELYAQSLIEWNKKMNLTAITEHKEIYLKHFYDSLSACFYFDFRTNLSVIDIGAGAGFPGLPIKICFPQLNLTLVDALKKRTVFLEHVVEKLRLKDVHIYHDRAENFAHKADHRESYDVVLSRAVARLNVLAEYCLPVLKPQGRFIALKGLKGQEEMQEAQKAIDIMGGELNNIHYFPLPNEEGNRYIIVINKIKHTPQTYPRQSGTPQKKPIK